MDAVSVKQDTSAWLEKAVQWRNEDVACLQNIASQLTHVEELSHYFISLNDFIKYCPSIDGVLDALPTVGQLLGRICSLPAMLQNQCVFSALVQCLLAFCTRRDPISQVEHRAKTWAMTQIRSIVSSQKGTAAQQNCLSTDYFYKRCQMLISSSLCDCVAGPVENHLPMVDICLSLYSVPGFSDLLEKIVTVINGNKQDAVLQKLEVSQKHPYTEGVNISLSSCLLLHLWKWDVAVMEHELLDLVSAARNKHWQYLATIVKNRHLHVVYNVCRSMWVTGQHILWTLWHQTRHPAVTTVLTGLHRLVCSEVLTSPLLWHIPKEVCFNTAPCNALARFRTEQLTVGSCCHLIHLAAKEDITENALWLMLHPDWWTVLLLLPLTQNRQVSEDCSTVLNGLLGLSFEKEVREMMDSLRGLLHKSCVRREDVQCAVASSAGDAADLVTHLLVFFSIIASNIPEEVISWMMEEVCHLQSDKDSDNFIHYCKELLSKFAPKDYVTCNMQSSYLQASLHEKSVQLSSK